MTEQQFKQLKQRLDASAKQSPTSLDDTILSNASMAAEQSKLKQSKDKTLSSNISLEKNALFSGFLQTTFAQSAFISISLTIAVFTVLALLIKPDVEDSTVVSDSKEVGFKLIGQTTLESNVSQVYQAQTNQSQVNVLIESIDMPQTQQGRDQILAQMPLPDVQVLLDEMVFSVHQDREFVQSMLSLAMKDIRIMIDNENLNGARIRYARLKENCATCPLPKSLEALLIHASQEST